MNTRLTVVIFTLLFLTTSAHPLQRKSREATWNISQANQAHDKRDLTKTEEKLYKSHIDSGDLYDQDDHNRNPIAGEMQHKLHTESERLRVRLRQELAELQERLSPPAAHLGPAAASVRERLAPLAQELQRSLSSNTQDLCGQLSLYLRTLEAPRAKTEASPPLYRKAFESLSQTLERSSSEVAQIISDFHTKTTEELRHLKEISAGESELWQEMSSSLEQEVSSLKAEARSRVGALEAELAAALQAEQPQKAELAANVEHFCQSSVLQTQAFQARLERLFQGIRDSSSPSHPPSGNTLTENFTVQLSALIHDILDSV
uniref:Zgc:162608 n=1 Tax=Tetraodon nigroviridis TaxID=99883 RepID=H3BWP4_TETNG